MSESTLAIGGGSYLNVGLRQSVTIGTNASEVINTFNGLSVVFYSNAGDQITTLTAGRGNGAKLNVSMEFSKYGNLDIFSLEVLRNLDIPYFTGMNVRFYYKNNPFAYGYIETIPSTDQQSSVVLLNGVGHIKRLMDKKITKTYTSKTVKEILDDLGSTYFLALVFAAASMIEADFAACDISVILILNFLLTNSC